MSELKCDVGLVFHPTWLKQCQKIPFMPKNRTWMTMCLIQSYGLTKHLKTIRCGPASRTQLESFHSKEYLDYCQEASGAQDQEKFEMEASDGDADRLCYDCPLVPEVMIMMEWLAGASVAAARALTSGNLRIAINWGGGWHHSQRDNASGFCYVNDIVLAIHELRQKFNKVLYIDLDIHHGDGVENAFGFTDKVMTFSVHCGEAGFFPCTGKAHDVGYGRGKYHSINVPLMEGASDQQFSNVFLSIYPEIVRRFRPDAIVVQCGADCLAQDPLGAFNLSLVGTAPAVRAILETDRPTLFLGGGGYHSGANSAKYWTYLTSVILGMDLPEDIPDSDRFFSKYGPSFEMSIGKGRRPNRNSEKYIKDTIKLALGYVKLLPDTTST